MSRFYADPPGKMPTNFKVEAPRRSVQPTGAFRVSIYLGSTRIYSELLPPLDHMPS
jgi:hypothetical protein